MLPGRRADNGSIFVVQGPAPVGALMEGGVAVTPLGAIYVNMAGSVWSPIDLFQNNEQGAWYDPSDLTTMFQDSAGTTPVTADGQPVGKILDKSGRGNHASQATAAARPLYKTDGTYHWLQFDGVDDSLSTAAIDFTSTDKMSVFSGYKKNIDTGPAFLVETSIDALANNGAFYHKVSDSSGSNVFQTAALASPGYVYSNYTASTPETVVISDSFNMAGATAELQLKVRKNGVAVTRVAGNATGGAGNFGAWPMYVGARNSSGSFLNGNIYSLIVRGALSTTQEITDTETWVNSKCGAY